MADDFDEFREALKANNAKNTRKKHYLTDVFVDELSLVDLPAVPSATFIVVKRDVPPAEAPRGGASHPPEPSLDEQFLIHALSKVAKNLEEVAVRTSLLGLQMNLAALGQRMAAIS
jgi:hypothetical protein